MIDWEKIRSDFPVTKNKAYFISAGMTPIPTPVLNRILDVYKEYSENGDVSWVEDSEEYLKLRARIGGMINASKDDVIFVGNTSTAMSLLALSLQRVFGKDFNIVSMTDEFPSSTVPYEYQGITMKYVEPVGSRYPIDSILGKIDGQTRIVVTSYVQYCTGFRQDVKRLGAELKKREILFVVNATQAFPVFSLDVKGMNIDAMTASLVKWGMTGPIGALFYTSPGFRRRFRTPVAGWLSVAPDEGDFIYTKKNHPVKLLETADQYTFGGQDFKYINTFGSSLEYLDQIGPENVRKRIFELTDILIAGLKRLNIRIISPTDNIDERSAIVAFNLGDKTADAIPYLESKRIYVSYRKGNIRASLNIFNSEQDIETLLNALRGFIQ